MHVYYLGPGKGMETNTSNYWYWLLKGGKFEGRNALLIGIFLYFCFVWTVTSNTFMINDYIELEVKLKSEK